MILLFELIKYIYYKSLSNINSNENNNNIVHDSHVCTCMYFFLYKYYSLTIFIYIEERQTRLHLKKCILLSKHLFHLGNETIKLYIEFVIISKVAGRCPYHVTLTLQYKSVKTSRVTHIHDSGNRNVRFQKVLTRVEKIWFLSLNDIIGRDFLVAHHK